MMLVCSLQIMLRHDSCSLLIGWPSNVDGTDDGALSPVPSPQTGSYHYQSHGRRICSVQTRGFSAQASAGLQQKSRSVLVHASVLYLYTARSDLSMKPCKPKFSVCLISDERYTLSNSSSSSQADEL